MRGHPRDVGMVRNVLPQGIDRMRQQSELRVIPAGFLMRHEGIDFLLREHILYDEEAFRLVGPHLGRT